MKENIRFLLITPAAEMYQVGDNRAPQSTIRTFRVSMLPCLYVAASMPSHVTTRIVDENVEPIDAQADVDLVGISCSTFNAPRAYEIADAFRARGIPVMLGGFHPTFMPEEALGHADAVCVGEAETALPHMMADFEAGKLGGIYSGGLADINTLPTLNRDLLKKDAYLTVNTLQATRGCPHACTFCSVSKFHEHHQRFRPVESVLEELRQLGRHVLFTDDNLIGRISYAKELFRQMIPLNKRWYSQCSIRIAGDDELLDLAARSGCRGLFIGFESMSEQVLRSSHKGFNISKDYAQAIRKLHSKNIAVYAAFVFGIDGEDESVYRNTLDFLQANNADILQAMILTPYPGTELREQFLRDGRIFDHDWSHYDGNHVVYHPQGTTPERLAAGRAWVHAMFHSRRSIAQRTVKSLGYLNPGTALKLCLPLNVGQRVRLQKLGMFEKAKSAKIR